MSNILLLCIIFGIDMPFLAQPDVEMKAKEDRRLIMKVTECVEMKIAIEKIEECVGKKATINTLRRSDNNAWSIVKIRIDTKKSQVETLRNTRNAIYWVLNTEPNDCEIVGVVWTKGNEMKLFFGVVLDP